MAASLLAAGAAGAQVLKAVPANDNLRFQTVKANPITPVRNQASSSTCWCFSGLAMIESELLRTGKGEYDLSAMYIVHKNYRDKAAKYVRMHGENTFSPGGSFADVLEGMRLYGIVPTTAMPGLNYGTPLHKHSEMDNILSAYVGAVIKNSNKQLTPAWMGGFVGTLDSYLGQCPEKFTYNGKEYTPQSFMQMLGIDPADYVSVCSFTHVPFYTQHIIEVPDNWRWAPSWNLPLEEMMQVMYNAIDKGYTIAWGSDVSEAGFTRQGIARVPDTEAKAAAGSDQARWVGSAAQDKPEAAAPAREKTITQQMRQQEYDNYMTTDDHGMLIYGTAKDQDGTPYFMVKNSWGTENTYKGTWYASDAFVRFKTLNIVVHKDAIPAAIAKKLGLK